MAIEKTQIELSEKDLHEILCKHFGLQEDKTVIDVYKYNADFGDPREHPYVKVTVTGIKNS